MSKINKLGKSTFVIAILSLILVAVLSFGGTYAYFSAKTKDLSGTVTTGTLKLGAVTGTGINNGAWTIQSDEVVPNQQIYAGDLSVATTGTNIYYYIRVTYTVTVSGVDDHSHKGGESCGDKTTSNTEILNIAKDSDWVEAKSEGEGTGVYYLATGTTPTVADSKTAVTYNVNIAVNNWVGKDGCDYWMGATITVTLKFEALQAQYLTSSTTPGNNYTVDTLHAAWNTHVGQAKS